MRAFAILVLSLFFVYVSAVSLYSFPSTPSRLPHLYGGTEANIGSLLGTYKIDGYTWTGFNVGTFGYAQGISTSASNYAYLDLYYGGEDDTIAGADAQSGIYYGQYRGASPIDDLLQIQSQAYILVTWNKLGYRNPSGAFLDRINTFQLVVATNNVDTYFCYIYPDAAATGNPNGGLDWGWPEGIYSHIGVDYKNREKYDFPDSGQLGATGMDGVPGDRQYEATFTGTHSPGQFCFTHPSSDIIFLGPASITSPTASQQFSVVNSIPFVAQGLLDSRTYSIQVNGQTVVASVTSTAAATLSTTLDLSAFNFDDGTLTVSLVRASDSTTTASVNIIKDVRNEAITSPSRNTVVPSTVTVSGVGDSGSTVLLTFSDTDDSTADVSTSASTIVRGAWSFSNVNIGLLSDGAITISARFLSAAGTLQTTVTTTIIKDTVTFVSITSPTASSIINQFNVRNFPIRGTGEAGGSVVVKIEDSSTRTADIQTTAALVSEQGSWEISSVDLSSQTDGSIRVKATITDAVGNTLTSSTVTLFKDTTVLVAISSPLNSQFVISATRAPSVSISGYADLGTNVFVTISDSDQTTQNVVSATVAVTPVGTWNVVANVTTLKDGLLTFTAAATDGQRNIGTSNTLNLMKDTVLTGFEIATPASGSSITQAQAASLLIAGRGEAGGRLALRVAGSSGGVVSRTVAVDVSGAWTTTVNVSALPIGGMTISGTATDQAANSGAISSVGITKRA